jgi:hypothetical protein
MQPPAQDPRQPPMPQGQPTPYGPRAPVARPQSPPTWLNRNLGWVVSVGCLGMIMLGCLFIMSIFGVATTAMKSSDAYALALSAASHDPIVLASLGAPLKVGWFVSGSVHVSGSTGHADLSIPVSGSIHSGKVLAVADKSAGTWTLSKLKVTVDGRAGATDLLPKLSSPTPPASK